MLITKTYPGNFGTRKRTIGSAVMVGPLSFKLITIAILALIALFYLVQSSQGATSSMQVYELQQEQQKLTEDVKRLQLEAVRLKSLNEIQKGATNLEPVKQVNYLPDTDTVSVKN